MMTKVRGGWITVIIARLPRGLHPGPPMSPREAPRAHPPACFVGRFDICTKKARGAPLESFRDQC
eukprot:8315091-Alexandrium_andersonii.AAC.1